MPKGGLLKFLGASLGKVRSVTLAMQSPEGSAGMCRFLPWQVPSLQNTTCLERKPNGSLWSEHRGLAGLPGQGLTKIRIG